MALYPQTTCFYKAIVNQLPFTAQDDYEVLFEDSSYDDGFAPPLPVAQRYVIAYKDHKKSAKFSSLVSWNTINVYERGYCSACGWIHDGDFRALLFDFYLSFSRVKSFEIAVIAQYKYV